MKKKERNYEGKEAECPYDTYPDEMEEGVSDKKYYNNEKNDKEKDAECHGYTYPVGKV